MNREQAVSPLGAKILALLAQGLPAQAIANQLQLREQEIEDEVSEMMLSLGLHSRVELILFAYSGDTEKERTAAQCKGARLIEYLRHRRHPARNMRRTRAIA